MKFLYSSLSFVKDLLDRLTDAVIILVLLISVYIFIDTKIIFDGVSTDKINQYKPESSAESAELVNNYEDYVFWLEIYDTPVSFPVVQGKDNSEYLNKAPDGSYSLSGSIFMDSRNSYDLSDEYTIIYGHHMDNAFFGHLDAFGDKEYFDAHREGYFLTKDGKWVEFETFAFIKTVASEQSIFNPSYPVNKVDWARDNSLIFVEPSVTDGNVVSLTTCISPSSTDRWALFLMIKNVYEGGTSDAN